MLVDKAFPSAATQRISIYIDQWTYGIGGYAHLAKGYVPTTANAVARSPIGDKINSIESKLSPFLPKVSTYTRNFLRFYQKSPLILETFPILTKSFRLYSKLLVFFLISSTINGNFVD